MSTVDPETPITLDVAGRLFVPPKTRMALDRLTRRRRPDGSPVLWSEVRDDRIVTTYAALVAYATDPRTRNRAKLLPLESLEKRNPASVFPPEYGLSEVWGLGERGLGQTPPDVLALERTVEALAQENARLRIEIEHLRVQLGHRTGEAVSRRAPR